MNKMIILVDKIKKLNYLLEVKPFPHNNVLAMKKSIMSLIRQCFLKNLVVDDDSKTKPYPFFYSLKLENIKIKGLENKRNELKKHNIDIEFVIPRTKRRKTITHRVEMVLNFENKRMFLFSNKNKLEVLDDNISFLTHTLIDEGMVKKTHSDKELSSWREISIYHRTKNLLKIIHNNSEYLNMTLYKNDIEVGFGIADSLSHNHCFHAHDLRTVTVFKDNTPVSIANQEYFDGKYKNSKINNFIKTIEQFSQKNYGHKNKMATRNLFKTKQDFLDFIPLIEINCAI